MSADLLVVLNPRRIPECLAAIEGLEPDILWLRNLSEYQIQEEWPGLLDRYSEYDRWVIVGDDCVPRQHALDAVLNLSDEGHPIVTGWSNIAETDMRSNLAKSPLKGDEPAPKAYNLYTAREVFCWLTPEVPTYLTGLTLCAATVDFWREYPFQVFGWGGGWASDYHLSKRLERDGVPIVGARDGFCWHYKHMWGRQDPDKKILAGIEEPEIVLGAR